MQSAVRRRPVATGRPMLGETEERLGMRRSILLLCSALAACASADPPSRATAPSPYLLVFAGDRDEKDEDFLAVVDLRPDSDTLGRVVATRPVGLKASMPHHMEYELPPAGEPLFVNAHHHEQTLLVDTADPLAPKIVRRLAPPPPFRFTHDYKRLPSGRRLVGFLRSEGPSPKAGDDDLPGGHGGIAEYDAGGALIRQASAAVPGYGEPIRPYAFALLLDEDRIVTTSAPMMEDEGADVVQVWRYSDLRLLHTLPVPPGVRADGTKLPGAARFPFEPRVMADGSVLLNAYGCGFYRLTGAAGDRPELSHVHTIQVPEPEQEDSVRGACGVPVVAGRWWVQPVGRAHKLVVLDVADPARPREVASLATAADFNPHWSALDPRSDRIVVGAELGGEQGMMILRLDRETGALSLDERVRSASGRAGYVDLALEDWPHGKSGPAWGHAALFVPAKSQ